MGFGVKLGLAMAALLLASAVGRAAETAVAHVEIADDNGGERLTLSLSAPVAATAHLASDPDRVIVDLPEIANPPSAASPAGSLIANYHFAPAVAGKSALIVGLSKKACIASFQSETSDGARLALRLAPCDAKPFADALNHPVSAEAAPPPPIVVIDPGHGGADSGAHGVKGALEKTLVFDFASDLKRVLEASGRYKVVMTRDGDQYVSLEDRVRIARDANAALMISIHADTFPARSKAEAAEVFGTTVYTCSDRASDAEAARIASRENAADRADKPKPEADADVADILFALKRRETRAYAHMFSREVVAELKPGGRLSKHPERSAGFFVLKAPDFPSVLVELGYVSNAQDVANMADPEWRKQGVASIAAAIDRFFGSSAPPDALATTDHGAPPH